MMIFFYVILFFTYINFIVSIFQPCRVKFGSNHYDLNQLNHLIIKGDDALFEYAFTPCGIISTDQCGTPTFTPFEPGMTACQKRTQGPGAGQFEASMGFLDGYGKSPNIEFSENTDGPGTGVIMIMKNALCNGIERFVTATFICDKTISNPTSMVVVEFPTCQFKIYIKAAEACPIPSSSGVTGGVVFIIILVILLFLYILGGVAYNKFKANETGWGLLPHKSFWLLLLELFLHGCRFSLIFIRTYGKPSTNNYNSV